MKKYISPIVLSLLLILSSIVPAATSVSHGVYNLDDHSDFKMLLVDKKGGLSRNAAGVFPVLLNILESKTPVTSKTLSIRFILYKPYKTEILGYIKGLERDGVIIGENVNTLKEIFNITSLAQVDKVLSGVAEKLNKLKKEKLNELNGIGI